MCSQLWRKEVAQTNAPIVSGAHHFDKIGDGIYYATGSGAMQVGANSPVIVTDTEAIIIDSETSPAAGRALVQDIKAFTDKPVKFVIDSHYHYDHLFGNQIFGPEVQVIGHDHTRERLKVNTMEQYTFLTSVNPLPARVESLRQRIALQSDPQQSPPDPPKPMNSDPSHTKSSLLDSQPFAFQLAFHILPEPLSLVVHALCSEYHRSNGAKENATGTVIQDWLDHAILCAAHRFTPI